MNIHKYLLPASIAATVHVALFWLMPDEPHTPSPIEVPLVTEKPPKHEPVTLPQEEEPKRDFENEVKPIAGGPTPPMIDEPLTSPTKNDITIPVEERPKYPSKELQIAPKRFGPGDIGDIGDIDLTRTGIFSSGDLDRVPRAKVQFPPDYPYAMKQSGASGSVVVEFDVDAEGRVIRAEAIRHTDREFVEPAVRAVRKWRFEPGRRHGKAVPFRMTVPIEFGIENN